MPLTGINLETMKRDEFTPPKPGDAPPAAPWGAQKGADLYQTRVGTGTGGGSSTFGAQNRPVY